MPMSEYVRALRAKVGHDVLMMPAGSAVVVNDKNEVLLQHRSDTLTWGFPSGALDPSEDIADCVVREVYEETGVMVVPERITSVLAGRDFLHTYPNGDKVAIISVTFRCRPISGEPRVNDDESLAVQYFPADALPDNMLPRHHFIIEKALENNIGAYFHYQEPMQLTDFAESSFIKTTRQKVGHDLLMCPGSSAVIINSDDEVLLQLRSDERGWGLPGGLGEPGEHPSETLVREVYEETGLIVRPKRIIAVLAGQDHIVTFPNQDVVAVLATVFLCEPISGNPKVNDNESLDVRYFPLNNLPDNLLPLHRFRVEKALEDNPEAFFRFDEKS